MSSAGRLERARAILDAAGVDGLLVSRTANKRWLSGFVLLPGEEPTARYSGTLLLTRDRGLVLCDGRYTEQAASQCAPGWEVTLAEGAIQAEVRKRAAELGLATLGAEAAVLSHADWSAIEAAGVALRPVDDALNGLRLRKDADEVAAIGRGCDLTDACFEHLLGFVRPGMTERELAWEIEAFFRTHGADGPAFDPLVLSGARASMPHGHTADVPIEAGRPLLIDFGCQVDGYRSDMTRTIFLGEPDPETRRCYEAVIAAQERAFETARVGVIGREVDLAARESLTAAGLGEAFTHGLGHGIGLETHEDPMLRHWDAPLEAGMVFTLEPGVYLPGELGIRIEDDVHLTDTGPLRLTHASRDVVVL